MYSSGRSLLVSSRWTTASLMQGGSCWVCPVLLENGFAHLNGEVVRFVIGGYVSPLFNRSINLYLPCDCERQDPDPTQNRFSKPSPKPNRKTILLPSTTLLSKKRSPKRMNLIGGGAQNNRWHISIRRRRGIIIF